VDLSQQLADANAARTMVELSYQQLQTQAAEWQAQLALANNQNAQLSTSLTAAQQEATNLHGQLASVQAALDAANGRLTATTQLVGLYEQLHAAGLDGAVEGGLATFTGALAALLTPASALRTGLDSARGLLASFELALPDVASAMHWLGEQVVRLKVGLWSVESSAQETAGTAVAGIAAAFTGFVGFVIDHLPFNIGAKVRATLAATQGVLSNVTELSDQAADKVMLKISQRVEDGPQSWKRTLVEPLRAEALNKADEVLKAVNNTDATYQSALKGPAETALQQRRTVREQIAAFRATHGI
jgi:chromosome segregation ATPase